MNDDQPKPDRPVDYTTEIGMTICERLVDGESLPAICADPGMPNQATISSWLAHHKEFHDEYAFAREWQADRLLDEIIGIVRDTKGDRGEMVRADGKVVTVWDPKDLARRRLRVDIRFWVAERLAPKKYG
jgi:hypothetical protein